jgi:hypothetical protein
MELHICSLWSEKVLVGVISFSLNNGVKDLFLQQKQPCSIKINHNIDLFT